MAPTTDIDREIDEELRQERATEFWRKYSGLIYALCALIILAVAGWRFYLHRQEQAAAEAGARYEAAVALSRAGQEKDSLAALESLAKDAPAGYGALARLRAAAEIGRSDRDGAVKAFDALAADDRLDATLRDVARLRAALLRSDVSDRAELERRLAPLAASDQPFRVTAREVLGLAALKASDYEAAGRWFDLIATDALSGPGVRQRADAYLAIVRSSRKN